MRHSLNFYLGCTRHELDVLEPKEEVKPIRWAGFKLPIDVPQPVGLVIGMHQV
jgi:hypothetical protein